MKESSSFNIGEYLGKRISLVLQAYPFCKWDYEKVVETDLPAIRIHYLFRGYGVEFRCDKDEIVNAIFLDSDDYDEVKVIPFAWGRSQVHSHFGRPSRSGGKLTDPILGNFGAWDRFSLSGHEVHVEYRLDADQIKRITLMCGEAAV